ncbi:MAG TPA: hypothetical protein VHW73_11540 [Rudaea sp.]|jgi:hypothetical protein|nr:hypothetical protein [Rudaea sp.]
MKSAGLILEKIARMTRAMRLRRHVQAVADAVGAMSPAELLQLRDFMASLAAAAGDDASERGAEPRSHRPDDILHALGAMSIERQLNSDSAIVRIRYIARWLMQAIHLTVGVDDPGVRAIYRKAVAIVRVVQSTSAPSTQRSWFIARDKKAS